MAHRSSKAGNRNPASGGAMTQSTSRFAEKVLRHPVAEHRPLSPSPGTGYTKCRSTPSPRRPPKSRRPFPGRARRRSRRPAESNSPCPPGGSWPATCWKKASTASWSCSWESRSAISSLCSGLSTTWAVEKDRFSRLRPRPPDSVLRSRFIRFFPFLLGHQGQGLVKVGDHLPLGADIAPPHMG